MCNKCRVKKALKLQTKPGLFMNRQLAVSDVHGDFETETHVYKRWCGPLHFHILLVACELLFKSVIEKNRGITPWSLYLN